MGRVLKTGQYKLTSKKQRLADHFGYLLAGYSKLQNNHHCPSLSTTDHKVSTTVYRCLQLSTRWIACKTGRKGRHIKVDGWIDRQVNKNMDTKKDQGWFRFDWFYKIPILDLPPYIILRDSLIFSGILK